jgi:YD repeat-containing protein
MGNLYTDTCLLYPGVYTYMVRGLKMENSPSGTYYNLSQGISDTAWNSNYLVVNAAATYSAASNVITFTNNSTNATTYAWDFGDNSTSTQQNPTHPYLDGSYTVTLIAGNGCDADTITIPVVIATGIHDVIADAAQVTVFPNPSSGMFTLSLENRTLYPATLAVFSSTGACVYNLPVQSDKTVVDLSQLPSGMYSLLLRTENGVLRSKRIVINR